jgi:hypothetical protein
MFYCNECAEKNKWPTGMFKSFGPCEICGKTKECNDIPSRLLPPSPPDNNGLEFEE